MDGATGRRRCGHRVVAPSFATGGGHLYRRGRWCGGPGCRVWDRWRSRWVRAPHHRVPARARSGADPCGGFPGGWAVPRCTGVVLDSLRRSCMRGSRVVVGTDHPTTGCRHGGAVYSDGIYRSVPACAVCQGGLLRPAASDRRCGARISLSGAGPRARAMGGSSGGCFSARSGAADRASPRPPAGCVG